MIVLPRATTAANFVGTRDEETATAWTLYDAIQLRFGACDEASEQAEIEAQTMARQAISQRGEELPAPKSDDDTLLTLSSLLTSEESATIFHATEQIMEALATAG